MMTKLVKWWAADALHQPLKMNSSIREPLIKRLVLQRVVKVFHRLSSGCPELEPLLLRTHPDQTYWLPQGTQISCYNCIRDDSYMCARPESYLLWNATLHFYCWWLYCLHCLCVNVCCHGSCTHTHPHTESSALRQHDVIWLFWLLTSDFSKAIISKSTR